MIACHMLRRVPFEGGNEQVEEIAIEGIVAEKICFFLNFLVVIDVLLQVEEILAVIAIVFDKLPGYGIEDVAQYRNMVESRKSSSMTGMGI